MGKAAKNGFNPKVFLAKVGTGKTISNYRKDQVIFSQGDVADIKRVTLRVTQGHWFDGGRVCHSPRPFNDNFAG